MMTRPTTVEQIREANTTFLHELTDLETLTRAMTAVPANEVGRRLRLLRGTTAEHFALEEQNAYVNPILTCSPDAERKRHSLLDEHHSLLVNLDALIQDAGTGEGLTADLRERLSHWMQEARRHEEREGQFFAEVRDEEPC